MSRDRPSAQLGGREGGSTESAVEAQRQEKTRNFGNVSEGGGRKNECGEVGRAK